MGGEIKNMATLDITSILLSILTAISLGLTGFSLKWQFDANAEIKVLTERLERLEKPSAPEDKQDNQIKMFWKLHSWNRTQIERLGKKDKVDIDPWPDLAQ